MISAPVGKKPNVSDFPLRAVSKFLQRSLRFEPIRPSESSLSSFTLLKGSKNPPRYDSAHYIVPGIGGTLYLDFDGS
jgi:hypothetical protein